MKINSVAAVFLAIVFCASFQFYLVCCEIQELTNGNRNNVYFVSPAFESIRVQTGDQNKFFLPNSGGSPSGFLSNRFNITNRPSGTPDKNFVNWIFGAFGAKPQNDEENCSPCQCGISYKMTRIVGGVETQVNMYPWIATLTYNSRFYCGATVINNKYLLTAAHCVNGFTKERLGASFLVHDRDVNENQSFTKKIKNVIRHRSYHSGALYNNDIALLELDSPLEFNNVLRPVCLPSAGRSYSGQSGVVIGWGATVENGHIATKLREVEVPILSNEECKKTGYGNRITDNMLCAGYPEGMKDSCQGDSGGPLLVRNGTRYEITGVVSWGEGCAKPNYPGVYTRVNRYLTWITSNAKNACYCN
ncbi:trypsin-1-like isoform X2 [Agrilus planipennis]|nr:trypsin-1-like isoform X2 [Agrilus planipennis]